MTDSAGQSTSGPLATVFADDLAVGDLEQLGEYVVTRDELIGFASHWDDQWFHTDEAAAADGHFGDVIASGIHTLAIMQKLTVETVYDRWAVVAGRGMDRVRFIQAVRPGDTLTGAVEVADVTLEERRGRVTLHQVLTNQHDATVLVAELTVMVFRRAG